MIRKTLTTAAAAAIFIAAGIVPAAAGMASGAATLDQGTTHPLLHVVKPGEDPGCIIIDNIQYCPCG